MMAHTYRTEVVFSLSDDGPEHRLPLILKYTVNKGYAPTLTDPGEGPSVNISSVTLDGKPAPEWFWMALETDEALPSELLSDAAERDEYARDQAADARREELRMERGA